MKKVIVRYKVKPEHVEENKQLIRNVFEELKSTSPGGLKYTSYVLADGLSFVHIASIETPDGTNPLNASAAFKEFAKDIKNRCDELPMALDATIVGSYGI